MSGQAICKSCVQEFDLATGHDCPGLFPPPARRGGWIQTFTGRQYWPLDPRADEVYVEDIAHHLSLLCRYTGACSRFYSVAEHSVHVSHIVEQAGGDQALVRAALLHDASEAYCNDIARPVKRAIEGYEAIETANTVAIASALNVALVTLADAPIKQADNAMLLAEAEVLMRPPPVPWSVPDVPPEMLEVARYRMRMAQEHGVGGAAGPSFAERAFLGRYQELTAA